MKFRFFMTYVNARESSYGCSLSDGNAIHARGWDAGVKVTPRTRNREDLSETEYGDSDEFDVYMTWGSHGGERSVQLGTVRDTERGPVWIPVEDLPVGYLDVGSPRRLRKHRRPRRESSRSRFTPAAHMTMTPAPARAPVRAIPAGPPPDRTVFGFGPEG